MPGLDEGERAMLVTVLEILLLVPLAVAIYSISRRRQAGIWHCWGLTGALAAKTFLFLWAMLPDLIRLWPTLGPTLASTHTQVLILHVLIGAAPIILGWWIVLVLQAGLSLPRRLTPDELRPAMVWTTVTWVAGLLLGIVLYALDILAPE